MTARTW